MGPGQGGEEQVEKSNDLSRLAQEAEDITCPIADMEVMKQEGWIMVFVPSGGFIAGRDTSGQGGGHKSSQGWKDVLGRIKDNNPGSTIDV